MMIIYFQYLQFIMICITFTRKDYVLKFKFQQHVQQQLQCETNKTDQTHKVLLLFLGREKLTVSMMIKFNLQSDFVLFVLMYQDCRVMWKNFPFRLRNCNITMSRLLSKLSVCAYAFIHI